MQNSKTFPGENTPDPRFRGEESWFYFSENVPTRSYSNAEFKKFPKVSDPRFWEREVVASSWNNVWLRHCQGSSILG